MRLPKPVKDNLFFLLAETQAQISNVQVLLETASGAVAQRILDRRGYTYNLKMRIHNGCLETLRRSKENNADIFSLRAAEIIASDLERLSNICQECVGLVGNLKSKNALKKRPSSRLLHEVLKGVALIEKAVEEDDTRFALKIGDIERKLDRAYSRMFKSHIKEICKKKQPEDVIMSIFVAQRIEEMGDILLNICESIMTAKLGQPMHFDRYRALQNALSDLGLSDETFQLDHIADTKSGSGIAAISDTTQEDEGYLAIFKDGRKDKLKEERESVESWHEIYPGLAPKILSFKKEGKNAALLIEHLPGTTFEHILLYEDDALLGKTLKRLTKTLKSVWAETFHQKDAFANHMGQLRKRLSKVQDVHPSFVSHPQVINGLEINSLDKLIEQAEIIEADYRAPFSVYIHGDFNLDNIIFDEESKKIHFIDLHRSCYQDYSQDISVFMVSNYRLQVLDRRTRERITNVAIYMYEFAQSFARKQGDKGFEIRLALGLARSFITSTRFILDKALAQAMYMRAIYILEQIVGMTAEERKDYKLPIRELFK